MDKHIRDVLMDALIFAVVTVQVYLIVDEMTDGKLSRELSVKTAYWRQQVKEYFERERIFEQLRGHIVFDAINIIEDTDKNREN